MVQEPEEAKFDGMPVSAISTGLVDYVLSVNEMGQELKRFINTPPIFHSEDGNADFNQNELKKILNYVDKKSGLDFREYKYATLARRIARRVNICNCNNLNGYLDYLKNNDVEVEILYREFLIGVTKFFRDEEVWNILRNDVFPEMIRNRNNGDVLKIWDVGCSTGEEAYSFAMCLLEEMQRQDKNIEIKIFATDISQAHLDIGSKGLYPESIVADVPKDLLLKYFLSKSEGYQVSDKLRRSVIFSRHNIIKNPPFSNMDMVVCRNLLIYFQNSIQKKAMNMLHYALKKDGVLVLGTSENPHSLKDQFSEIDRKWKIFRNKKISKRLKNGVTHASQTNSDNSRILENNAKRERKNRGAQSNPIRQKLQHELNEAILGQFGGAAVFVDTDYNILQAVGEFRKYAALPVSGFSINLLDMLDSSLKYVIQSTFNKALESNEVAVYKDVVIKKEHDNFGVDVIIKPLKEYALEDEINYVIIFVEKDIDLSKIQEVEKVSPSNQTKEYVSNLENELKRTREDLQTSLEEIETSNEELQAANEELLASNEELQSTNEELETSKEELQSINEELTTLNTEYQNKITELSESNNDISNILANTEIAIIFLDLDLRIKKLSILLVLRYKRKCTIYM